MKVLLTFAALIAVTTAVSVKMAPLLAEFAEDQIPGSYIVVFHPDTTEETIRNHHSVLDEQIVQLNKPEENSVKHRYSKVLKGYSARMNDRLRDQVRAMPEVKYVERNQKVSINQGGNCVSPTVESWGVPRTTVSERISQEPDYEYLYEDICDGEGVDVYVIDTGIDKDNTGRFFEERVEFGADFVDGGNSPTDPNGHGTHVAGTVASIIYGLAVKAKVISVRVLNAGGSGSFEAVIAGVEYVAKSGRDSQKKVINMSLGGGYNQALIDAVEQAFNDGVHVVVAAGNENSDACTRSPAGSEVIISVGATTINDERATFSNYGRCVDIFGPGSNIVAPYRGGVPASLSGTSMASPHIAGVIAKMLTRSECRSTGVTEDPAAIKNDIIRRACRDRLDEVPSDTPNLMVHMPCPDDDMCPDRTF